MSKDLKALLGSDENIVLQTRQHWFVLVRTAWLYLAGMLVSALLIWAVGEQGWLDNTAGDWLTKVIYVVLAVFTLLAIWRLVGWLFEAFYLTTSKVVYVSGILSRKVVSTPFVKIDEVTLVRPLLGRMLGFGRLDVENASGGSEPLAGLEYLPKPAEIYQMVTERARHQRMLEGGGRHDADNDGYVDDPAPRADAPAPRRDDGWTPPGSGTSTST